MAASCVELCTWRARRGEVVENVESFFERKAATGGNPAHEPDSRENYPSEVGT